MDRRATGFLILLGLIVAAFGAWGVSAPGYMDADYYYATAMQLAEGEGFWEPFLWNYLDQPAGLPHPSHLYWMPLTSIIAAIPMLLFGVDFRVAQLPFALLAALLPLTVARLALILHGRRDWALLAGILAAWPGFYAPYLVTTDSFVIYAYLGAGLLGALLALERQPDSLLWLTGGLIVGLAHLARAEGPLLFLPLLLIIRGTPRRAIRSSLLLGAGYLLVMGPWFLRNLSVAGSLLSPAGLKPLWLQDYADLFAYPADGLTPEAWLGSGPTALLRIRINALGTNLQRVLGENGLVMLAPFIVVGAWSRRKHKCVVSMVWGYMALIFFWSFIFPLQGAFGGMFHAGIAWMPLFWALVPAGLDRTIERVAPRRGWSHDRASRIFSRTLVALAAFLTIGLYGMRVVGATPRLGLRWSAPFREYQQVGEMLRSLDDQPGLVVVNNPPGFYIAAGLPAIVVPHGPVQSLHAIVERYRASWVILDVNRPPGLNGLYAGTERPAWLQLRGTLTDESGFPIHLFRVIDSNEGVSE